jgi:hypothetical protein
VKVCLQPEAQHMSTNTQGVASAVPEPATGWKDQAASTAELQVLIRRVQKIAAACGLRCGSKTWP